MPLLTDRTWPDDSYQVEALIGEGAFAEVYRVRDQFLERRAMKIFKAPGWSPDELAELLREAVLLSKMNHPNLVRLHQANTVKLKEDAYGYFTMEYMAGGSLFQYWQSFAGQLMPAPLVIDIMRQVCQGVAVAHSESPPIVHRDIRLQNILIGHETQGIRATVSDFGLAKNVNPLTQMDSSSGTVSFKAPEALQNPQWDSPRGDVWALGSIFYLLLTNRLPYDAEAVASLVGNDHCSPAPPSRWNAHCDSELDAIVLKALQVNPQSRYASALELLFALVNRQSAPKRSDHADEDPSPRPAIDSGHRRFEPYAPLFVLANADLYQTNAFRLTSLPVTATAPEIMYASQEFALNKDLQRPGAPGSLIPYLVAPSDDEREAAFTRIRDPEQRLLHEFFWFWADGSADTAFAAVRANDLDRALAMWRQRSSANDPRGIAVHNLAVFNHLMALQVEGSLLPGQRTASADFWAIAFHYWSAVVGNDRFWDHFAQRVKDTNDPRLTPDHAEMLRNSLPQAILYINARNAVAAAERGDFEEASGQRRLMYGSGLGEHNAEKALYQALKPVFEHLTLLCDEATVQVDTDPVQGAEVLRGLRNAAGRLLKTLNCLLGAGDPNRNRFASAVRDCLIDCANQAKAWDLILPLILPLFEDCLALAEEPELRGKLSEDVRVIEGNLERQQRRPEAATAPAVVPPSPSPGGESTASSASYPDNGIAAKLASTAHGTRLAAGRAWNSTSIPARVFCLLAALLIVALVLVSQRNNSGLHATPSPSPGNTPVAGGNTPPATEVHPPVPSTPVSRPAVGAALPAPSRDLASGSSPDVQTLRTEIAQSNARLQSLEKALRALTPVINDYRTSIDADKTALDRMDRDSKAGTHVDHDQYELVRRRHDQNVAHYNSDIARYNALARDHSALLAEIKARTDKYRLTAKSE